MRRALLLIALTAVTDAELLDRLAVAVGKQTITELQLDEEIRVTAFLNDKPVRRTDDERRAAADRLVQQLLVKREMELSRYPLPTTEQIETYYAGIRTAKTSPQDFGRMLAEYQLTPAILKAHLAFQLTTLQFVEYRFRPDLGLSDSDIEGEYSARTAAWKVSHPGRLPASLEASRESIRQSLIEERTNQVLETWIEESRKQVNIVYLDQSLR